MLRVFVKSKVCFNVKCEVPKGLLDIRKIIVLEKSDFWAHPGELPGGNEGN